MSWIRDESLSQEGERKILQAELQMLAFRNFYSTDYSKPLFGERITGCVSMTKETGVMVLALQQLGAEVRWCSDNRFAHDDSVAAFLDSKKVEVFGQRNMSVEEYFWCMDQALDFRDKDDQFIGPTLIIDDGCDLTEYFCKKKIKLPFLKIITEQTTCGALALKRLIKDGLIDYPVYDVNDSYVKKFFDNYYGVRESVISALHNSMGIQVAGLKVGIWGYGEVGSGCANAMKDLGACVSIVESDILKALSAHMAGFKVENHKLTLKENQLLIVATGCKEVISVEDLKDLSNFAILANIGHGTEEYPALQIKQLSKSSVRLGPYAEIFEMPWEKSIISLCNGALINMIAANGNPPNVMTLTFCSHIFVLLELVSKNLKLKSGINSLSNQLEKRIATFCFPQLAEKLYQLRDEQKRYLSINE